MSKLLLSGLVQKDLQNEWDLTVAGNLALLKAAVSKASPAAGFAVQNSNDDLSSTM